MITNTTTIPAVHVRLEGYTAFFRQTSIISGNQLTLPCPTYANLLGLISCCADKTVLPTDTRIGFEFNHVSKGEDLERTYRLQYDNRHKTLKEHTDGQGIVKRQTHFRPTLDLYLTNLALAEAFRNPVGIPTLGRSQDLCWIKKVEQVELTPAASGNVGSTLIGTGSNKQINPSIPSDLASCTEWFSNDQAGIKREAQTVILYQATVSDDKEEGGRTNIAIPNLYHPSNLPNEQDVIYLHEWNPI